MTAFHRPGRAAPAVRWPPVKLLADLTPLRESPAFRRIWAGTTLSAVGGAMTSFALTLQVWDLTRSTVAVGLVAGLFTAAVGVGGMVTAVLSGPLKHVTRQGAAMLVGATIWGAGFAVFAVAHSLWLTLLALGVAGAADTITVVARGT